jgi:hypothetical protein
MIVEYMLIDEYLGGFTISLPRPVLLASAEPENFIINTLRKEIYDVLKKHNLINLLIYNNKAEYYINPDEFTISSKQKGIIRVKNK